MLMVTEEHRKALVLTTSLTELSDKEPFSRNLIGNTEFFKRKTGYFQFEFIRVHRVFRKILGILASGEIFPSR